MAHPPGLCTLLGPLTPSFQPGEAGPGAGQASEIWLRKPEPWKDLGKERKVVTAWGAEVESDAPGAISPGDVSLNPFCPPPWASLGEESWVSQTALLSLWRIELGSEMNISSTDSKGRKSSNL